MNLGPSILPMSLRRITKSKENKKVIKKYHKKKLDWSNKSLDPIKKSIRLTLREKQQGRCIYCRRIIKIDRRNPYEDIEHYLDKSRDYYRKWSFTNINLTLACRACNFVKTTKDLGNNNIHTTKNLKNHIGDFKWLHPYFHDYHANIEILQGWIYKVRIDAPNPIEAQRMIFECELDEIVNIERRNEQHKERLAKLLKLSAKSARLNNRNRNIMLSELAAEELNKHWFDW